MCGTPERVLVFGADTFLQCNHNNMAQGLWFNALNICKLNKRELNTI
jgi:hypothetical protein